MHSASMIFWAQVMENAEHIWRGNWCWNTHKYICTFWWFGLFLLVQIQKTRWFRHYWILWYVTPPDSRAVIWPFTFRLTVYSPKPQQSVRQWRPFAKDNEANPHKAGNVANFLRFVTNYFSNKRRTSFFLNCAVFTSEQQNQTFFLHMCQKI